MSCFLAQPILKLFTTPWVTYNLTHIWHSLTCIVKVYRFSLWILTFLQTMVTKIGFPSFFLTRPRIQEFKSSSITSPHSWQNPGKHWLTLVVIAEDLIFKMQLKRKMGKRKQSCPEAWHVPGTAMSSLICKLQAMRGRDVHDSLIKKTWLIVSSVAPLLFLWRG